MPGSGG